MPVVTVSCVRDLAQLDLQAQSIQKYLAKDCPVYIIVNEDDTSSWFDYFNKHLRHYYNDHDLTILEKRSWNCDWDMWIPSKINPWHVGWETQQILKLLISEKIESKGYLILDSQNFLISDYDPNSYSIGELVPFRQGNLHWGHDTWNEYCNVLGFNKPAPNKNRKIISICTPIFFHTELVRSLINAVGNYQKFALWFKSASRLKSEFILYYIWALKTENFNKCHYRVQDWGNPYLRDSQTFDEDFEKFLNFIGVHKPNCWVSANHRAWGIMNEQQYSRLKEKLSSYGLIPNFDQYRSTYIDLKF